MARRLIRDIFPGTLDLLILRTLQTEPLHGWAISERIQQISQDVLQVNQGSLYPALHRLEHQGWIDAEWSFSELGRRAKYYHLTASGRRQLAIEAGEWERMAAAIARVLNFHDLKLTVVLGGLALALTSSGLFSVLPRRSAASFTCSIPWRTPQASSSSSPHALFPR